MDLKAHKDLLRKQFAIQARVHSRTIQFRRTENVTPMIELSKPQASDRLLDVATGWGFVALTFAPLVQSVVGVDLTPEMVTLARKVAADRGVKNVEYVEGDAEDLPYLSAAQEPPEPPVLDDELPHAATTSVAAIAPTGTSHLFRMTCLRSDEST